MSKKTYFQQVNDNVNNKLKGDNTKDLGEYMRLYFLARDRYVPRGKAYGRLVVIEAVAHWKNLGK